MNRPLLAALLTLLAAFAPVALAQTGQPVPQMAHYDAFAQGLIAQYGVPGLSLAVMKDGRLVYARGFGMADPAAGEPVQPDSRFRIASLSKAVTSAAVMRLVDQGLLDLDAPAFALLPDLPTLAGQTEDPRLATVTVRNLLLHTGGWDRDATGYDPMFDSRTIATAAGVPAPAGCESVIRYMRGRPLDFTPGSRYAYSNFGYCVLGRIVERASGQPYETFVRSLLGEAGAGGMRLGATRAEGRLPGEVRYVEAYGRACPSVFPPFATGPCPYGEFYLEAMDAHGGWVASAVDLARFIRAVDGRGPGTDILSASAVQTMTARPNVSTWNGQNSWYAFGWQVNTFGHWWHSGALNGTRTFMARTSYQGLSWVVLVNSWPYQNDNAFISAIDNGMWTQAQAVTSWPSHDLFAQFPSAGEAAPGGPSTLALDAPYPNPAAGATTVRLTLGAPLAVSVGVFDVLGREVAQLHDGPLGTGAHRLAFDATALAPGVYVVRASTSTGAVSQRVNVVR
ncbi:MAG TPA: serine hydrolase [Rubricoccaceae bacterium]|jgi:N-acyl-D-amino-acid deacylase